ncbi:calvin cycle protein CP12-1, chloroplastic-like [Abrus precatorius]|uniref:Calvin cycle protein CP12-1, chloroplastic-like n=1 Tax=Abrus precatorius TaxID=3816 RepID=A0A8B8MEN7_ABRPR|nr:calvin cycle protein CP12-1, chloroplastic-like [Abrus precatorius]
MATIAGVSISSPSHRVLAKGSDSPQRAQAIRFAPVSRLSRRWPGIFGPGQRVSLRPIRASPEKISEKVAESIKTAEEACSGDAESGECVAAWDEVEELSAAASHARDKQKSADPLEKYCKDNPETDECRTYDN